MTQEATESAEEAGLRYVTDTSPGISRRRAGKGFTFVGPEGERITDRAKVEWIRGLAIPPAWTDVWICPSPRGHLQATGRDARGRKQYRYHPEWRAVRDDAKYERMLAFGKALPRIRRRVDRDMRRRGLPRERVLAAVVRLLEKTPMRIGNEEYARDNKSFGLTTLRDRHATIGTARIHFRFRGKGGKDHEVELSDARLARIVSRCQDLPGQELFAYLDADGEVRSVESSDVNDYLREISGQEFTAKDFRTWSGTVLAAWALREFTQVDSEAQAKRNVVNAVERVAEWLGNTPAVSRKSYVHPSVIDAYLDGDVVRGAREAADEALSEHLTDLTSREAAVLALLRQRLRKEERKAATPPRRAGGQGDSPRSRGAGKRPTADGDGRRSHRRGAGAKGQARSGRSARADRRR
ncbi:MAG TPA: DNA topoisomerase IB [Candidatus Limnocylindria bacterium]|nr:DNA topoisomerase IB [Candidatus Limnocylindria bacterium]